ncbi:MAG TPA: mannosyltransferase family protein [Candidatus Limnocylindria bacterium]|nr:mannosyltransferase family protein [Candidatus Limnocylindria bacterium]
MRLERSDWLLAGAVLAVKLATLLYGVIAYGLVSEGSVGSFSGVLGLWNHWDTPHYLDVANWGYLAADPSVPGAVEPDACYRPTFSKTCDLDLFIVFYPLYPWLTAAAKFVLGDVLLSAFVVSGIASLFVAPLLYRLVRIETDPGVAGRAAIFALIFPTAYFLHIGYTEALFMALVLGSFLAARTDRWWLAGLLGGLAALTRVNGLILVPALAAEAATQWFGRPPAERRVRPEWLAIGLVLVGFGVYLGVNQAVYGEPFAFLRIQDVHWFKSLAPPWEGIAGVFGWLGNENPETRLMIGWMELLFIGIGLVGTVVVAMRFRPSWFVWMAGNWLLFVSTSFVLSVPRYALTLFPIYAAMAVLSRRWQVAVALGAVSLIGYGFFAMKFANGGWAF